MIKVIHVVFFVALLLLAHGTASAQWKLQASNTTSDFRGLCAVSITVAWASGTHGTFAHTTDGGKTWRAGTVVGAENLDFRDVEAMDANTAYLLSIGKGEQSRIYKTTDGGAHWVLQFTNHQAEGFFDAMAFWDRDHGIAMSDPVDGRFLIITTDNGGKTWNPVPATNLPPALPGEGAFAASGTCITVQGQSNVWFATGGAAAARVFRSVDRGRTWSVATTPIASGIDSAGIFSIAFKDAARGIIVGGDYRKPNEAGNNVATTNDGGRTWKLISVARPAGYRSCVVYIPDTALTLVAVGTSGSDLSTNGGGDWTSLDRENYNSVSFVRDAGWAAGPRGHIAKYEGARNHER